MTKVEKLRLCDSLLLLSTALMLASSIQLEATGSRAVMWVWLHVAVGICFFANIAWHLQLHFGWKNWVQRLAKQKSPVTRWLSVFAMLTLLSAVVAFFHWLGTRLHSPVGGIHGKLGFIFLILAIGHTIKRARFFRRARS